MQRKQERRRECQGYPSPLQVQGGWAIVAQTRQPDDVKLGPQPVDHQLMGRPGHDEGQHQQGHDDHRQRLR